MGKLPANFSTTDPSGGLHSSVEEILLKYSTTISEMLFPTVLAWRLAHDLVSFSMERVNFSFMGIQPIGFK
jgi:hypothetical protein